VLTTPLLESGPTEAQQHERHQPPPASPRSTAVVSSERKCPTSRRRQLHPPCVKPCSIAALLLQRAGTIRVVLKAPTLTWILPHGLPIPRTFWLNMRGPIS
jgi:hypothetical protein